MNPPSSPPAGRTLTQSVLFWGVRGGTAGLLAFLGLWSMQGISVLFQPEAAPPAAVAVPAEVSPLNVLSQARLATGAWQFADRGWEVHAESFPHATARERALIAPVGAPAPSPQKNEVMRGLLGHLQRLGKRTEQGELVRYELDQLGQLIVGFTSAKSPDEMIAARMVIPYSDGKSWLVEQTPAVKKPEMAQAGLGPFSEGIPHRVLCSRMDAGGDRLCQFLVTEVALPDVLDRIRQNSWEFDVPASNAGAEFVTIHVTRRTESYWLIATPGVRDKSLRILMLRDGSLPTPSSNRSFPVSEDSP